MNPDFAVEAQVEFHFTSSAGQGPACDNCGDAVAFGEDLTIAEVQVGNFTSEFRFHASCTEEGETGFFA